MKKERNKRERDVGIFSPQLNTGGNNLSLSVSKVSRELTNYQLNTFKYLVSCTDEKISVTINLLFYLYFPPSSHLIYVCMFLSCRPFVVITLSTSLVGVEVTSVSWLGQLEFKSLIKVIVSF